MTIMKAIAMTALAGTILAGPSAAIAKSTDHGNSAAAHLDNDARQTAHDAAKAAREAARDARKATQQAGQTQDDQDEQGDQDEQDDQDTGGVTDGTTGDATGGTTGDATGGTTGDATGGTTGGMTGDVSGEVRGNGHGLAKGQPNFGTIVSGLHRNGGASVDMNAISDLSGTVTVQQVDLTAYDKGNRMRAIDNALKNVDSAQLQSTLSANADVTAALEAQNIDVSTVAYAYVNADGSLVVYTR